MKYRRATIPGGSYFLAINLANLKDHYIAEGILTEDWACEINIAEECFEEYSLGSAQPTQLGLLLDIFCLFELYNALVKLMDGRSLKIV